MKTIINSFFILLVSIGVLSCKEDENITVSKSLSGKWELTSVSILENGQWNEQDTDLGTIFFEACEDRNQNCQAYRELADGSRVPFEYIVSGADQEASPTRVSLLIPSSEGGTDKWQGAYDIVALSTVLTLERVDDDLIIRAKRLE